MNYNNKFNKQLEEGEIGERVFASYIKKFKGFNILNFNTNIDYDILTELNGKEIKFEIKTDRYEFYKKIITNNMFIEVNCNGKVSGLSATKADIFVYFFPDYEMAYVIKVNDLRNLIRENGFRRTTRSGDKGKVTGYLIDRHKNAEHFKIYNIQKLPIWNNTIVSSLYKEKDKI